MLATSNRWWGRARKADWVSELWVRLAAMVCQRHNRAPTICLQNTGNASKAVVNIPNEPYRRETTYDDSKRKQFCLERIVNTEPSGFAHPNGKTPRNQH